MADRDWHYIGDGVYVKRDFSGVWLHANHHKHPTDRIYLEWPVFNELIKLLTRLKAESEVCHGIK